MKKPTVEERVDNGATWLDEHVPDWPERITLPDLDMRSDCNCVVGQVVGDYSLLRDEDGDDIPLIEAAALGFDAYSRVDGPEVYSSGDPERDTEFTALQEEWKRVIAARLGVPDASS